VRDSIREWAKTLAFSCELPLPLPLQVDDLPSGVRIAMVRLAPGGGLAPVGELVFAIDETEECDVSVSVFEPACDWRATVLRRWPEGGAADDGPLPGETRILDAMRREFAHLITVGDGSPGPFGAFMPSWLAALGAWALPSLGLNEPRGGDYRNYHLQRSCRLGADGLRPPSVAAT
jgi:hypothetical protein